MCIRPICAPSALAPPGTNSRAPVFMEGAPDAPAKPRLGGGPEGPLEPPVSCVFFRRSLVSAKARKSEKNARSTRWRKKQIRSRGRADAAEKKRR
jgi:hypothetical protein